MQSSYLKLEGRNENKASSACKDRQCQHYHVMESFNTSRCLSNPNLFFSSLPSVFVLKPPEATVQNDSKTERETESQG
jgi:hypothetical protein